MANEDTKPDPRIDLPATETGDGSEDAGDPFAAPQNSPLVASTIDAPELAPAAAPAASPWAFDVLVAVVLLQLILLALAAFRIIRLREQLRADRDTTISARSEARQARQHLLDVRDAAEQETQRRTSHLTEHNHQLVQHCDELEQINARLRELVKNDPLTGLVNGARFTEQLEAELRRCLRIGKPLTVMICDVDKFRQFNATHGEQRGDLLLQSLGGKIESLFRRGGDTLARLAADRFAILAPDTDYRAAVAYAEEFRQHIEQWTIPVEDGDDIPPVTVSIGITEVSPESQHRTRRVLERAALALGLAKEKGGNRVFGDRLRGPASAEEPQQVVVETDASSAAAVAVQTAPSSTKKPAKKRNG
ncbi:MAG: GGDEF domain-containing protein [Gammaproteobacteria bacterium]